MTKTMVALMGAAVCGGYILPAAASATVKLGATVLTTGILLIALVGMAPVLVVLAGVAGVRKPA